MSRMIIALLSASAFFAATFFHTDNNAKQNPLYDVKIPDSTITVTLSFTGDLMCHGPQYSSAFVKADSFDFSPVFRYVKNDLSESDFTIGNLETVTAGKQEQYSGYPNFNTPEDYLDALKNTGFDFVFTSNNHSLDRGETGVRKTIAALIRRDIGYCGTYSSQEDRDSVRIINVKGMNLGFLAYTYGTNYNRVPKGRKYLVNMIDKDKVVEDIKNAKKLKPDVLIVYLHFGNEYQRQPSEFQNEIVNASFKAGADIIIGTHPHVIQKAVYVKNYNPNMDNNGFVAYSLGNFISNQRDRYTGAGMILNLSIQKNLKSGKISVSDNSYLPTFVYKGNTGLKEEYIIVPDRNFTKDNYLFMADSDYAKIKQAFTDTKEMLGNLKLKP